MTWPLSSALDVAAPLAFGMLAVAMTFAFVRLVRGPSLPDRVMALDLISVLAVGMVGVFLVMVDDPAFLDVATVVALISFLSTVSLARYIERGAVR